MDDARLFGTHREAFVRAVRSFWATRSAQAKRQGSDSGRRDTGNRTASTGGAQMREFARAVATIVVESGLPADAVHTDSAVQLPGWFRPEKKWDLVVVHRGELIAAVEFKSHIGPSFGNNTNNRVEEALGNATDIWAAYREGAFAPSARPWLGYLMLLEDCEGTRRAVGSKEPHFQVFPEFRGASYAERYRLMLTKLQRDRLYDASCLLLSESKGGKKGDYSEPDPELGLDRWVRSLVGRIRAAAGA